MQTLIKAALTLALGVVVISLSACSGSSGSGGGGGGGAVPGPPPEPPPYTGPSNFFAVYPDGLGGFAHVLDAATAGLGNRVDYPGVTALMADLAFGADTISPDGQTAAFTLTRSPDHGAGMLWLRIISLEGADLVSQPTVSGNARGEAIFVLGPLAAAGSLTITLTFSDPAGDGFSFEFDLLEVLPRVAFGSDRAVPGDSNHQEIYTIDPVFLDSYTVTENSPRLNTSPVWSPGGEWIAYDGLELAWCMDSWAAPPRINLVHPDGSTGGYGGGGGGKVAQGVFASGNAAFNPTGELIAFYGRKLCEKDTSDTSIDIYLYDIKTGVQTVWFSGDEPPSALDFFGGQVYTPEWSPDGNYVLMQSQTPNNTKRWYYAPVDPLTGATIPVLDSLGVPKPLPIFFSGHGYEQTMADGDTHVLRLHEVAWAPDSSHIVARASDFVWNGASWDSQGGIVMFDFQDVLDANTLPIIPEFEWVANFTGGNANFPNFDMTGDQVWFDGAAGGQSADLQYVTLTGYVPPAPLTRATFLNDAFSYRTPALWPPALSAYFPLLP